MSANRARASAILLAGCLSLTILGLAHGAQAGAAAVPDDIATPGDVRHDMNETQIAHMKAADVARRISAATIREVAKRYGITLSAKDKLGVHDKSCGKPRCEIDHRVPHGCGGADTAENLWYQDGASYAKKDRVEHYYEARVRTGEITVAQCQAAFRAPSDWRDLYRGIYHEEP